MLKAGDLVRLKTQEGPTMVLSKMPSWHEKRAKVDWWKVDDKSYVHDGVVEKRSYAYFGSNYFYLDALVAV